MAFGRINLRRAGQVLLVLALSLCALASQAASAQAGRVPVEGLPAALSDGLKRLQREEPNPETLFEAQRQADRAAGVAKQYLESQGYYLAEVEARAEGVETFTRRVIVTPGPLFTYASRRIEYLNSEPDAQTKTELEALLDPIDVGFPALAQPVIDTGDKLVANLRAAGYPDARAEPVDALADGREHTIELAFQLQPGFRASFGDVKITGLDRTREDFLDKLIPWQPNERYSPEKLDEYRSRLAETGLFSTAAARLAPDGAPQDSGLVQRDVLVEVAERKRRTIALGASASTSDGAGLDAEWELRNFSGRGDSIEVKGTIATLQRRLEVSYRDPHIRRYNRNLRIGAKIEDFETDAFDQTGGSVFATMEEPITPRVRGSLGVEAGYASILDDKARTAGQGRRNVYILSSSAIAEYTGVRDILDPQDGVRARVAVEPGVTYGDTTIAFARLTGEASGYFDIGENLIGAVRGKIGTIAGPNGVPPDRLFFAGGGGSVRGYEYQSLSPRAVDPVDGTVTLIGGRSLIEMSAEVRWRAGDRLGYVAFLDAGAAGSNVEPPIDQMRAGVGVGVRYYAGFGPLRADIAIPLNKEEGDADFQIYISIGQAF
jgi:translocation and assembly module TamA